MNGIIFDKYKNKLVGSVVSRLNALTLLLSHVLLPLRSHALRFFCFFALTLLLSYPLTCTQVFAQEPLQTVPIEKLRVLKIASSDERAVVKSPDGKLHVIKVGDIIGNKNGSVIEITEGRVVVEEILDRGTETVIFRVGKGKQQIERLKKGPGKQPMLFAPNVKGDGGRPEGTPGFGLK